MGFQDMMTMAPLNMLLGLFGAAESGRQEDEARQQNIGMGKGVLDLLHGQAGMDTSGYNIPSLFGHQLKNPFDSMGGSRQFENNIANMRRDDYLVAKNELGNFSNWLNQATSGREGRMLGEFDQGASGLEGFAKGRGTSLMNMLNSGFGGVQDRMGARSQETLGGYANAFQDSYGQLQDRYKRGMANLEGMGDQARKDINQRYNASQGTQLADLQSRGLGNTTVRSGVIRGNERERGNELGRLDESIRAQRLNTDAALSGDVAAAKGADALNWSGLISGLRGDEANAASGITSALGNAYAGTSGDTMSILGSNFGNRMNLSSGLSGETLGAQVQGKAGLMDLLNRYRSGTTDWRQQQGAFRQDLGNAANTNYMNTILGSNFAYPQMSPFEFMRAAGSGMGGMEATTDAMNTQDKQFEQALTLSAIGMGMGPFGNAAGSWMSPGGFWKGNT